MKKNEKKIKACGGIKMPAPEKCRNGITELVFILDRSGSMLGLEDDTIGGFNSTINSQRDKGGTIYVSTVLFDHESYVLHDRVSIESIEPMTHRSYQVRGSTALLDAVGDAVHHIKNVHKYARPEDVPEHTIFVITTDGMENASQRYTQKAVKTEIKRAQKERGWEFIFLGANIDVAKTAEDIGIRKERAAKFDCNDKSVRFSYNVINKAIDYYCDDDIYDLSTLMEEEKKQIIASV